MASPSSKIAKPAATGILQSSLSPKYLHTNSTSHTWPFSAIAELIDNAYDPDVKASQLWIDKERIHGKTCLTFTDNGNGMREDKLHKMLSFGFCEKVADGSHMPVGHYGNGFKSGSMRLGKDALVLTKQENSRSVGYLSQTYLELIKAETVVVPITTWDKKDDKYVLRLCGLDALKDIYGYSMLRNEAALNHEFEKIVGEHGTRIIISNIRKTNDSKSEFDFDTDEYDIRIPDDTSSEGEKYRKTKRQNHVPECDYSLRAYCAILYLKPKMQIILRQKKVKTLVVEKSLSKTEVDRYKPTHAVTAPVKVVFGFNSRNKNHYGIMMYHRNRLIKPYERVGYQLKANNLGVGVVGVVQCDFLQPTHNKQDFDYTKAYRACISSLGVKLNEYWNEKKGPVKSSSNSQLAELSIPEPQEVQALPDQTWAQCDEPKCLKWRKLPDGIDPDDLPDKWFCYMNPDPNFKSCDVPEEKEDENACITPYEKVQKRRLVKEMEEKHKRERAAKLAELLAQEEKKKMLERREEDLKKKEEQIKLQMAQLEKDGKPKIKVESGSVPTAQVAPRPTMKPLNAVTPIGKQSARRIGGQLAARLCQSVAKTPQTNPSTHGITKPTSSPVVTLAQLIPKPALNQSTSRSTLSSQSAPRLVQTNKTSNVTIPTKVVARPNYAIVNTKDTGQQVVRPQLVQKLNSSGATFKMVKAANGATYLVQQKKPQITPATLSTKPSITLASTLTTICPKSSIVTTSNLAKSAAVILAKTAASSLPSTSTNVKPRINVLPKPQISTYNTATHKQQIVPSSQNVTKAVANMSASTAKSTECQCDVKPSLSLAATAYSEITGNTSTTPQDVKNILASGIKREAPENHANPIPAKVQRKNQDAPVIVIDPLVSSPKQQKPCESEAEKRIKELESRVKTLEGELSDVRNKGKEKMEKLSGELHDKSAQLAKQIKEFEEKERKMNLREGELKEKTRQLKVLRENVCKLLQVLVPEIDVESEGDGETVDDLLKQVLEANK